MGALNYLHFQVANGLSELIHMDHLFPFHLFPAARTGRLSRRHDLGEFWDWEGSKGQQHVGPFSLAGRGMRGLSRDLSTLRSGQGLQADNTR